MVTWKSREIIWSLSLVLLLGCGGGLKDAPTLVPISGKVTYQGKPLEQGEIVFQPDQGRPARGEIQNGEITNVRTGSAGEGVPVGSLKVAIFSTKPDPDDPAQMGVLSLIPEKYNDATKSGLTATAEAGQANTVTFDLTD